MYCNDFYIEMPAFLSHVDSRPLCNKGASKPKSPPPAVAPYRAQEDDMQTEAQRIAGRRKGLRSTILGMPTGAGTAPGAPTTSSPGMAPASSTLGAQSTALGSAPLATAPQQAMQMINPARR